MLSLEQSRANRSTHAQWWLFRGRIEESADRPESAIASWERAVALNPMSREAHYRLGQTLKRLGRDEPAQRHLERASRIEDQVRRVRREHQQLRRTARRTDPDLFEKLGRLCLESGLTAEAHAWYEQTLKVDPSRELLRTQLAQWQAKEAVPFALSDPHARSAGSRTIVRQDPSNFPSWAGHRGPVTTFCRGGRSRWNHVLLRERRRRPPALHRRHHGRRSRPDRLRCGRLA